MEVSGIGFKQFKNDNGTIKDDVPLFVKMTDEAGQTLGDIMTIKEIENDSFYFNTPKAPAGTKAILNVSFNQQQWQ